MATAQQYIGYDNIVTINNIAATSAQASYPVTNAANPSTALRWRSDSTSEQYVTVTNTGSGPIDYIGIAGHNFSTAGCSIVIEGTSVSGMVDYGTIADNVTASEDDGLISSQPSNIIDDGYIWSVLVDSFAPSTDRPILRTIAGQVYSGVVRLKITPSGSIKPQIGVLYVGSIMQLERGVYVGHTPITYGRSVAEVNGMAESGDFLGRIVRQTSYDSEVKISNMTPAWYRSTFEPFVAACATAPFFYAWRMTEYAAEVGYCWVSGGVPVPENTGPGALMGVSFKIGGIA